jgi:DNA-directed RNA polymerase subunit K/omega
VKDGETVAASPAAVNPRGQPTSGTTASGITRFHVAAIAAQRSRQLQNGSRPRVADAAGHKHTRVAILEVLSDAVSWALV